MLLSDPTTKKAASAKAETWRWEIFDICTTFSDEGDAEDLCGRAKRGPAATHSFRRRCEFPEEVRKSHLLADPRTYVVAAFWTAAKTSRGSVVPATCSVPATPRSIQPALMASNIASADPVWPFGMPNCSNAAGHPARGTAKALTSRCMTSPSCAATSSALTIEPS